MPPPVDGHLAGRKINKALQMLHFKKFKHHYVLNMHERVAVCLFLANLTNLHLQILAFVMQVFGKRHLLFVVYSHNDAECLPL